MPRERDDMASVLDMVRAARDVHSFIAGKTRDDFEVDGMLRAAVERKIEVVGEAARRLSESFRAAHPHVPWRVITATRHILAHDYDAVNNDVVWRIATVHIPALVDQLQSLLPAEPPPDEA